MELTEREVERIEALLDDDKYFDRRGIVIDAFEDGIRHGLARALQALHAVMLEAARNQQPPVTDAECCRVIRWLIDDATPAVGPLSQKHDTPEV